MRKPQAAAAAAKRARQHAPHACNDLAATTQPQHQTLRHRLHRRVRRRSRAVERRQPAAARLHVPAAAGQSGCSAPQTSAQACPAHQQRLPPRACAATCAHRRPRAPNSPLRAPRRATATIRRVHRTAPSPNTRSSSSARARAACTPTRLHGTHANAGDAHKAAHKAACRHAQIQRSLKLQHQQLPAAPASAQRQRRTAARRPTPSAAAVNQRPATTATR